uniref:Iron-sulfur cluster assembly 1 homolog, mitochondrial n=1 Tax=Meloidogyne incognita TaxID=6306 RepID=A0A914MKF5_MELIC
MRFCQILFGSARVVRSSGSRLGGSKGRQAISLTQAAVSRIKELIQQKPGAKALKIGVQQRGCSGLTYTLEYADQKGRLDEEVEQVYIKVSLIHFKVE